MEAGEKIRTHLETEKGIYEVSIACTGRGGWVGLAPAQKNNTFTRVVPVRWIENLERDLSRVLPE